MVLFTYDVLNNHLHNSQLFSSCVPSHHHWSKSTVIYYTLCDFCARCSQMLTEMCGRAGDKFVPWMTPQENVIKVSTCWQKWPFLSQIQVKQLTNPCHDPRFISSFVLTMQCWKRPYPSRSCLGNENSVKNGEGHMWEWCEIMKINTKFIK